ncbi:murein tripeptide amidase MpaA [Marinihelvus fidelis]|uniref:Murein tripeptide amidase MpaA n=1 Tax=Marinihelvus fidelis TaxID=2613842 RepID=A0A5N0TCQ6_9GAMM|nr:murein tripeptide amidase MpaA [Marinihelvus fidelis]KAA9132785.1 murein tripeptide amidase MpaA [Marinihelvus fidelis]
MSNLVQVPRSEKGLLRHPAHRYGTSERGVALEFFGPDAGPVDLLVMASMHGDECDSTVALSEALRVVPNGALANPVILSVNPDGILRGTRCNANGVDLNRNWPASNWSPEPVRYKDHGKTVQDIELSTGASAGSEAETQHLLALVERLRPRAIVSLHAPLGCIDDPDDSALGRWIAAETDLPLVPDVGYATPGSFGSWCAEKGIPIITWELPADPLPAVIDSHAPVLFKLITGTYIDEVG